MSANIKEADGTSGQNTNAGAGIKTDHIQDAAVTTTKIADGAVTDAKIAGPIAVTKLPVGSAPGTVAAGDHAHDAQYQKRHANVLVVARNGGDFTDPRLAAASITDASAANPYLIRIMPGRYNIGPYAIDLPAFVDMEGSGEGVTTIAGDPSGFSGIVNVSNSELRSFTVEGVDLEWGTAVKIAGGSAKLSDLTVKVDGAAMGGVVAGLDAELAMRHVTIILNANGGDGIGLIVQNNLGDKPANLQDISIEISNAHEATGLMAVYGAAQLEFLGGKVDVACAPMEKCDGIETYGGVVRFSDVKSTKIGVNGTSSISASRVAGDVLSVHLDPGSKVSFSELDGPIWASGVACFNVHDQNYSPVICP